MNRRIPTTLAGLLACTAAVAAGRPLPVDSPPAASRALAVAFDAADGVRSPWQTMMDESRLVASRSLALLDASTTPAQAVQGVTLACPLSGTLTAKLSRLPLRSLSITWSDCTSLEADDAVLSLDGPGELVLGANTFTPEFLLLLRLGAAEAPFVETWRSAAADAAAQANYWAAAFGPLIHTPCASVVA